MALLSGAALVVVPPERRLGGELAGLVAEAGVTHVTLPPAVLAMLDAAVRLRRRAVVLVAAGEALPGRRWWRGGRRAGRCSIPTGRPRPR